MNTRPFFTFAPMGQFDREFFRLVDDYRARNPRGLSGTIAEKGSFQVFTPPKTTHPLLFAAQMVSRRDYRISDPYGPAGMVECEGSLLFYGLAIHSPG
jgi:hypothetical protein